MPLVALERLQRKLAEIFDRAGQGSCCNLGLHVVLVGQPNVGKSSLLNRLAGDELTIVTPIAGTTRDALRSTIQTREFRCTSSIPPVCARRKTKSNALVSSVAGRKSSVLTLSCCWSMPELAQREADREIPTFCRAPATHHHLQQDRSRRPSVPERHDERRWHRHFAIGQSQSGHRPAAPELLRIAGWHQTEDVFIARERHLRAPPWRLRNMLPRPATSSRGSPCLELFAEELRGPTGTG